MITERTFTVTVSFVQHEGTPLPTPLDLEQRVGKALAAEYPGRSIHIESTYADAEYGKARK